MRMGSLQLEAPARSLPPDVPADWTVVELDGPHVAVAVPYLPWVRLSPLEICRATETPSCVTMEVSTPEQPLTPGLKEGSAPDD